MAKGPSCACLRGFGGGCHHGLSGCREEPEGQYQLVSASSCFMLELLEQQLSLDLHGTLVTRSWLQSRQSRAPSGRYGRTRHKWLTGIFTGDSLAAVSKIFFKNVQRLQQLSQIGEEAKRAWQRDPAMPASVGLGTVLYARCKFPRPLQASKYSTPGDVAPAIEPLSGLNNEACDRGAQQHARCPESRCGGK